MTKDQRLTGEGLRAHFKMPLASNEVTKIAFLEMTLLRVLQGGVSGRKAVSFQ